MPDVKLTELLGGYEWFDHTEGPKFVETHRYQYRTSGHWLFHPVSFSAFHRLADNHELWLIHAGSLLVHVLDSVGRHSVLRLGTNLSGGESPIVEVPSGCWQAA